VDVNEVADRLYALPPAEFTVARADEAARTSDAATARAIKALRRPTNAAHEVNALVRENLDALDELLAIGDDLRRAMAGNGDDVRSLTEQRRELISRLVSLELPVGVREDVIATLEAATADPDLGAAVRSGRLVKGLRYAGFGAMPDLDDALATPVSVVKPRAAAKVRAPAPRTAKKAVAEQAKPPAPPVELTAARQRVLDLAGAADDAQRRYELAARSAVEARRVLESAEAERAAAHKAAREAHAEADKARRELGRLERR
jgi:hypothetical protein